jgi:large subunit ribosomal protein L24
MIVKKNDTVKIIAGNYKGKTGKVLKTFPSRGLVLVEGVNIYKKHLRPRREGEKGEVVSVTRPIQISNVALLCSVCNKGVRVGRKLIDGRKIRVCKKCGGSL